MNAAESCFVVRWLSFDVASYAVQRMKRKLHRSRDGRRQVFGNAVLRKKLRNCTQGVGRTFHNVVADRAVHVDIKQASTERRIFEVMSWARALSCFARRNVDDRSAVQRD